MLQNQASPHDLAFLAPSMITNTLIARLISGWLLSFHGSLCCFLCYMVVGFQIALLLGRSLGGFCILLCLRWPLRTTRTSEYLFNIMTNQTHLNALPVPGSSICISVSTMLGCPVIYFLNYGVALKESRRLAVRFCVGGLVVSSCFAGSKHY